MKHFSVGDIYGSSSANRTCILSKRGPDECIDKYTRGSFHTITPTRPSSSASSSASASASASASSSSSSSPASLPQPPKSSLLCPHNVLLNSSSLPTQQIAQHQTTFHVSKSYQKFHMPRHSWIICKWPCATAWCSDVWPLKPQTVASRSDQISYP